MSQIAKPLTSSGPIPPNIPTSFLLDDTNSAVPLANVIQVHGVGASTSLGASNEIVITVVNDGFTWSDQAVSFAPAIQNGYFCTNTLTATLPVAPSQGNSIIFFIDTPNPVTILASGTQEIQIGAMVSVAGGNAVSNTRGATLEIVYRTVDNTWHTISSLGTWTVT